MIYCIDDFLDKDLLTKTQDDLNSNKFEEIETLQKSFWVQHPTEEFTNTVMKGLEAREGVKLECILAFFRVSTDKLDTDWRIHSDRKIQGQNPDRAAILYMSPKEVDELHGTAFWEHESYGKSLPADTADEEFDRMILDEANNLDKWTLSSVSGYEENRLLSYPASYFHSKYPNKSWASGRQVFVVFYKFKETNKDKLLFRPLVQDDYETISKWWKWWRWPIVPRDLLPNNGTGGFMIEKNNIPIVCGFLYTSNSKLAWLEYIVSNPEYREDDRQDAIDSLITNIEEFSKSIGIKVLFSIGKSDSLKKKHKKLGWFVDDKPSHEIIKRIQ